MTFSLRYLYCKLVAAVIRFVASRKRITSNPDEVYQIKSRDTGRTIKAHVYRSAGGSNPSPVLINFHGSGFLMPLHGSDDEFCRRITKETTYTILDVQYRLAPEHPFPAALNDVEDVVNWVLQHPGDFDLNRIAISGFSAGGNLALAASATLFSPETFCAVLAFYPALDLFTRPSSRTPPDLNRRPLPTPFARFFSRCYIPPAYDARDPRISPYYAQPDRFPNRILMITAAGDNLAAEAEELAAKIGQEAGHQVTFERMQGCNHAWDKKAVQSTVEREAKDQAYGMAVAILSDE